MTPKDRPTPMFIVDQTMSISEFGYEYQRHLVIYPYTVLKLPICMYAMRGH